MLALAIGKERALPCQGWESGLGLMDPARPLEHVRARLRVATVTAGWIGMGLLQHAYAYVHEEYGLD